MGEAIGNALGLGEDSLTLSQMTLRALIVYLAALMMVRLGEKRILGKSTAFDVILGIILGSVVSRAVNGGARFFETLGAGFVLVALHYLFAFVSFRSDRFGTMVKGSSRTLVRDGEVDWDEMRKSHISRNDLLGALRANGRVSDVSEVERAELERSGEISVLKKKEEPKVVEVSVRDGVQTVRIELG